MENNEQNLNQIEGNSSVEPVQNEVPEVQQTAVVTPTSDVPEVQAAPEAQPVATPEVAPAVSEVQPALADQTVETATVTPEVQTAQPTVETVQPSSGGVSPELKKKKTGLVIIIILLCVLIIAGLVFVGINYIGVKDEAPKTDDNITDNNDSTGSEEQDKNEPSEDKADEPQHVETRYTFVEYAGDFSISEVTESNYTVSDDKSSNSTIFSPSYGATISGTTTFGEFTVTTDGKVELTSTLDIPSTIASKQDDKYIMNLDNVKSVYSSSYESGNGDSGVFFVHNDGTVSILFVKGGLGFYPTYLVKNVQGLANIDYIAKVNFNTSEPTSHPTTNYAFANDGKVYSIASTGPGYPTDWSY